MSLANIRRQARGCTWSARNQRRMDLSQPPSLSFQPFRIGDLEPANALATIIIEDSIFLRSPNTVPHVVDKNYPKVLNRGQRTAPCACVLPSFVSVEA